MYLCAVTLTDYDVYSFRVLGIVGTTRQEPIWGVDLKYILKIESIREFKTLTSIETKLHRNSIIYLIFILGTLTNH